MKKMMKFGYNMYRLEKKRTSITRLKQDRFDTGNYRGADQLEKKRTSITRLKLENRSIWKVDNSGSWKEKNLDYEIETGQPHICHLKILPTWKEKNLDYEIETESDGTTTRGNPLNLKRKEPRLRDWNKRLLK